MVVQGVEVAKIAVVWGQEDLLHRDRALPVGLEQQQEHTVALVAAALLRLGQMGAQQMAGLAGTEFRHL